jgi:hypothetical protein
MADVAVLGNGSAKISEVSEAIAPGVSYRAVRVALGKLRDDGTLSSPLEDQTSASTRSIVEPILISSPT